MTLTQYLGSKGISRRSCRYAYSVFNATTEAITHRVFAFPGGLAKVTIAGEVVEAYKQNRTVGEEVFPWVSVDLETDEVVDTYRRVAGGLQKNDGVITHDAATEPAPSAAASKASEHGISVGDIVRWSQKDYGLVIEFVEDVRSF